MNDDDRNELVINVLLAVILVLLLVTSFTLIKIRELKKEAVKRGAAAWIVDDGGATTFTWKEPAK